MVESYKDQEPQRPTHTIKKKKERYILQNSRRWRSIDQNHVYKTQQSPPDFLASPHTQGCSCMYQCECCHYQTASTENLNHYQEAIMERLQRLLGGGNGLGGAGGSPQSDSPAIDDAETVYISSLALLKMLKHGRAGVPMEVMGLMLGEFVDEFTIHVIDVFAMPQSGTGVSVEAVDDVFQTKMMDMLRQTGRDQMVVGWYHSHPGFGCWLSSVDVNTQQSFEQLNKRAVAVVIDPIQSVKGKVVIDAFRSIDATTVMRGQEPRQSTSNVGHLNRPSIQALIHGLNRHYYSLNIDCHKTSNETNMLLNLHKKSWQSGLKMADFDHAEHENTESVQSLVRIAKLYNERVTEEKTLSEEQLKTRYVGKQDPKKHLTDTSEKIIEENITSLLTSNVNSLAIQ